MRTFGEIAEYLEGLPDEQLRSACLSVLMQVKERAGRPNRGYWTYDVISKWIGRRSDDPLTLSCVQLLTSSERARALDIHFLFFDPAFPGEPGIEIEDEEVRNAIASGELLNPNSGQLTREFGSHLKAYFEISAELEVSRI